MESILVFTDVFSKFALAVPCPDETAVTVARVLRDEWIAHYGIPLRIHSDQGRSFENAIIFELCSLYGIQKSRTTAYHPAGNGQCERMNKTLCALIRSLDRKDRRRWPELVRHLLYIYNSTPHRVTGVSPYLLMFGRFPSIPLDQVLGEHPVPWQTDFVQLQGDLLHKVQRVVTDRLQTAARKEEERREAKSRGTPEVIQVGDRVLLRREAFTGRHKLVDKFDEVSYIVDRSNETVGTFRIRPAMGGTPKWVNRQRLILDPRRIEDLEVPPFPFPSVWSDSDEASDEGSGSGSDTELDPESSDECQWLFQMEIPEVAPPAECPLRRSTRTTRGRHRNLYNLPTPAGSV